jgi:DNA-binding Xre family transcriptional regulator
MRAETSELDRLRCRRGWSWTKLAAEAGISRVTMSKAAAGQPVSAATLNALAAVLGVRPGRIIDSGSSGGIVVGKIVGSRSERP